MANAVSCGVPQNKMGHLAHNWCSSYVKCRHNINRLQNTRLLCSTNSESDSCLWFWRFFHMRWIHTVHFACLVKMWCFSWLSVKWICLWIYLFIHCLGCACCWLLCQEMWPSFGWSLKLVVYTMHLSSRALLQVWLLGNASQRRCGTGCKCGSLGTHHSADAALAASVAPWEHITAPMRHWLQVWLLGNTSQRRCGTGCKCGSLGTHHSADAALAASVAPWEHITAPMRHWLQVWLLGNTSQRRCGTGCKCGSLGTHHSADAALAARNRTCGKALRLERGRGTLSQLRQYRQARCLRTILEHWRNDFYCAVTDFWCSKYCYRHNLFNCVGSHHWKTCKVEKLFENELPYCWT